MSIQSFDQMPEEKRLLLHSALAKTLSECVVRLTQLAETFDVDADAVLREAGRAFAWMVQTASPLSPQNKTKGK